jgi:hypothetical protein
MPPAISPAGAMWLAQRLKLPTPKPQLPPTSRLASSSARLTSPGQLLPTMSPSPIQSRTLLRRLLYFNFTQIGSPFNQCVLRHGALSASPSTVSSRAMDDAAGNNSGYSNISSATTPVAPPSPTFISEYETVWNSSTSPKTTANFSVQSGDTLVAYAVNESPLRKPSPLLPLARSPAPGLSGKPSPLPTSPIFVSGRCKLQVTKPM